ASGERYDPGTGTWRPAGSMSTARVAHTVTLLPDGSVLIAGGGTADSSATLASAELFAPPASPTLAVAVPVSWTAGTAIPASSISATLAEGASPSGMVR